MLVQPYFQLKIKIVESSATRNLSSHSFSVMSLYNIVIRKVTAKMVLGTPWVVALSIYKWRRRHLLTNDVVEEFLQSQNNFMPIRYSYSEIRKMTKGFKD